MWGVRERGVLRGSRERGVRIKVSVTGVINMTEKYEPEEVRTLRKSSWWFVSTPSINSRASILWRYSRRWGGAEGDREHFGIFRCKAHEY